MTVVDESFIFLNNFPAPSFMNPNSFWACWLVEWRAACTWLGLLSWPSSGLAEGGREGGREKGGEGERLYNGTCTCTCLHVCPCKCTCTCIHEEMSDKNRRRSLYQVYFALEKMNWAAPTKREKGQVNVHMYTCHWMESTIATTCTYTCICVLCTCTFLL